MILNKPWLIKSHANNYWGKGYMTIGVHLNRHKVPFTNFVKNSEKINEYDDEPKIDQCSSFEGIYIDDSNEEEIRLYVLEAIPKVGVLSQVD